MPYTREQFIEDVKAEAMALRENATKEELERLDFSVLDPGDITACIYGMATADCMTKRACFLISKCCKRYVKNEMPGLEENDITDVINNINGEVAENVILKERISEWGIIHLSSIEAYITLKDAKNANLIAYLRGETDTLDL